MDKRRFLVNFFSNLLSALSGIGISFFLTPYIVATLGKETYGFYPLTNNFIMYTAIITTSLNSMSGIFITGSLEKKNIKEVNVYFNSVLFGNLIISFFFLILTFIFCYFIQSILEVPPASLPDIRLLFLLVFISLIINISSAVFSVTAFSLNRFDLSASISIISNAIRLLVLIGLFYFFVPKLYYLGLAAILTAIYSAFTNYRITKKYLPEIKISKIFFSKEALFLIVGAGIWNSVSTLSYVINTQLDLLIANKFFDASGMGLLSLTKFIHTSLQILIGIISPIFLPEMIKAFTRNDIKELKSQLDFSFKSVFLVALTPLSLFFVYGEEFFKLWLPDQDHHLLYLISIISLVPFVVHGTIETIHNMFIITKKLKIAAFWGIFTSILNFILVIYLCTQTKLGILAIPISALVVGVISHLTFTPIYASYCLNERWWYFYKKIVLGLLSFCLLIAIAYCWKKLDLILIDSWVSFIINSIIIGTILMVITIFLRFDTNTITSIYYKAVKKLRS